MAGTLTISTLSDGTNSTSATNCIQGSAKAWVNFNGVGGASIRASYNVSSVTRNATAAYQVNFTNAFADTNYATVITAGDNGSNRMWAQISAGGSPYGAKTTTYSQFFTGDGGGLYDSPLLNFVAFR